jgi:hypothetical protein
MARYVNRLSAILATALLAPLAAAQQFDNNWATFANDTQNRIHNPDGSVATQVTNNTDEKHFAYGDFDGDGWIDLVMVTKQQASYPGGRQGFLLMNDHGVLVDRTAQLASDSDYPGSMGLLDLVDSRKVKAVDVNHDGLLDLVTCATNLGGESANPKYISHPRVYINKGFDASGNWLGFRYEESRIPALVGANGQLAAPRFCSVAAGDVTGDGSPDLYFVQYHETETGYADNPNNTNGDRLLVNDGNGFFTDSGTTRMSQAMLNSGFGTEVKIVDINGDGVADVTKCSTLTGAGLSTAYNQPANVGFFNLFQLFNPSGSPYHIDIGDLNNDGKLDCVISSDGADRYAFNTGNDALGRVVWTNGIPFLFLSGGDDGFGSESHIVDLNNDGWKDIVISDFDHDDAGCSRRAHIYHNPGGTVGSTSIQLLEEAGTNGWRGARGILPSDLGGTFDEAVFDIDNDGDMDIVFGRCSGTFVWLNQESSCTLTKYGTPVANSTGKPALIDFSGTTSVSHNDWVLKASQCPHNKTCLFIYGTTQVAPVPFGDGVREIGGSIKRMGVTTTDASGNLSYPADFTTAPLNGLVPGDTRYWMLWFRDPQGGPNGYNGSSALAATLCP